MPITFACSCGKKLRAPDGSSGKKTRCPVCQKVVPIPEPDLGFAADDLAQLPQSGPDATGEDAELCPNCHMKLEPDAVLCIHCGTRLKGPLPGDGPRVVLPIKGIVTGVVVIVVLAVGWIFVAAPFIKSMKYDGAQAKFANGDLDEALAEFESIRDSMSGDTRKLVDLRIKQIKLEKEKNWDKVLAKGVQVSSPTLDFSCATKSPVGNALVYEVTVKNLGEKPLTLSRDYFYVKGQSHTIFVANHTDNTIDGVTVAPGKTASGIIVFRSKPQFPVQLRRGKQTDDVFFIMLNTGDDYVKRMWPF